MKKIQHFIENKRIYAKNTKINQTIRDYILVKETYASN